MGRRTLLANLGVDSGFNQSLVPHSVIGRLKSDCRAPLSIREHHCNIQTPNYHPLITTAGKLLGVKIWLVWAKSGREG